MITNTEWLRSRILAHVNGDKHGDKTESLEELKETEWSEEFEQLMRNRLIMGRFRHGKLKNDPDKPKYNHVDYIKMQIRIYEKTGNVECLADAANGCLLEFVRPCHPKAHFEAIDEHDYHCEKIE